MKQTETILLAALWMIGGLVPGLPRAAWAAEVVLAPAEGLPQEVREAPGEVEEAYRFAVANPELLKAIPCYCGCEMFQHRDNYACYVEDVAPDGRVVYSDHGVG